MHIGARGELQLLPFVRIFALHVPSHSSGVPVGTIDVLLAQLALRIVLLIVNEKRFVVDRHFAETGTELL